MSEVTSAEGTCLCEAVKVKTKQMEPTMSACHCGMCRTWGGGAFFSVNCGEDVEIEGKDALAVFDSSPWAERGFCKKCGTHLFYRLKGQKQYHVPVGLFGDDANPELKLQLFIDRKPDYYTLANETKALTEAQIFEMYAPKD